MGWIKEIIGLIKSGAEEKATEMVLGFVFNSLNFFGNVGFCFSMILIVVGCFALLFGVKKPLKWGFILLFCSFPFMAI